MKMNFKYFNAQNEEILAGLNSPAELYVLCAETALKNTDEKCKEAFISELKKFPELAYIANDANILKFLNSLENERLREFIGTCGLAPLEMGIPLVHDIRKVKTKDRNYLANVEHREPKKNTVLTIQTTALTVDPDGPDTPKEDYKPGSGPCGWDHSIAVLRDIRKAGWERREMKIKRDRCICETCGVEKAGWRPWDKPWLLHNYEKHPNWFGDPMMFAAIRKLVIVEIMVDIMQSSLRFDVQIFNVLDEYLLNNHNISNSTSNKVIKKEHAEMKYYVNRFIASEATLFKTMQTKDCVKKLSKFFFDHPPLSGYAQRYRSRVAIEVIEDSSKKSKMSSSA